MKVMILAAGRGQRMRELTKNCPKPLLKINGQSLIEHHIHALKKQGFNEFVINVAYLGEQIKQVLGDGKQWGVSIAYSDEGDTALETGGGIFKALPLLGENHFLVVNADVWIDFPYASLRKETAKKIHLVLVNNPAHNLAGDFQLEDGQLVEQGGESLTYSGVGVFHPSVFSAECGGVFPLAPLIRRQIPCAEVTAQLHNSVWVDVGTPERLAFLESQMITQ